MRKTILLVEEDADIINIYTIALKKAGFNVEVISLVKDMLDKLKKIQEKKVKAPDLILLNVKIDGINGFDVLRRIRKNKITKNLNVFILSNYPRFALEKLGFSDDLKEIKGEVFLLKTDYSPSELALLVKKRLKKK